MKRFGSAALLRAGLLSLFALLGAVGGYCYYHFVGCATGACAITSNPVISTLYGGVIGLLAGFIIIPEKKKG